MMKNNLWKTWLLTLLVIAALFGLFYLPRISIFGFDLKRVNILSDVQRRDSSGKIIAEMTADSIEGYIEQAIDTAAVQVTQLEYRDSVPEGMIPIEDFADVQGIEREMDKFYTALDESKSRPVRIAYYGDSYIEGDIITMDLRAMLQKRYGGKGVGFVEIECVSSDFRRSINTKRTGWDCYHANEKEKGFRNAYQGMAGSYFIPQGNATMEIKGQRHDYAELLDTAEMATVYFTPGNNLSIHYAINGGTFSSLLDENECSYSEPFVEQAIIEATDSTRKDTIENNKGNSNKNTTNIFNNQAAAGNVTAKSVLGKIKKFNITVHGGRSSRFYGVALDGENGITLDNFSMRGSGGQFIGKIPQETMNSFADVRPYDLIILHFGLNVADPKQSDYSGYTKLMAKVIKKLQSAHPNAAILVVSMGDRAAKSEDGEMHTMNGVQQLIQYERKLASDCHVAFWNLYQAMGGDGSIVQMKEDKLANLDYTHINFQGGKHLAKLLYDVLINGKENYDHRKANNEPEL